MCVQIKEYLKRKYGSQAEVRAGVAAVGGTRATLLASLAVVDTSRQFVGSIGGL